MQRTTQVPEYSDPAIRANREASTMIDQLRKEAFGEDHFAWQKLCHASRYLDERLEQILREELNREAEAHPAVRCPSEIPVPEL